MSEDADGSEEPMRSDGTDGSASGNDGATGDSTTDERAENADADEGGEVENPDDDATNADTGDTDGSEEDTNDSTETDVDTDSEAADDATAEADSDASPESEPPSDADPAGNGAGQEPRVESVEPPGAPEPEQVDEPAARGEDDDADADDEDEELTAAEKGMQTVENVGNALGGGDGPDSDQEMPLTAHIEEMMRRLSAVFAIAAVVSGLVLFVGSVSSTVPSAAELIRYFWDYHVGLPSSTGATDGYPPYVYGPLEYLLTKLKVVGLAGLLAGLPMFVYQTYRFMRPGLYPHERRYYLAAIPTSLVLGIVGAAFAHFAVLPFVFDYFISYTVGTAKLAFGLKETFNLILIMMGYFAIVFQIPLFIELAIMMGVVTREWLEDRRLIFWGAFLGLALTFISVDPTGFAPIIVVVTMIVLFEGTLAMLRWTGH